MADDLGDEWWLQGENAPRDEESEQSSEEKTSVNEKKTEKKGKKAKKRKAPTAEEEESGKSKKLKEIVKCDDEPKKKKRKKKRSRKKISEELSGKTSSPGSREDFLEVFKTTYKDKLSKIEWDEIQLGGKDFVSSNPSSEGDACQYLQLTIPKWSDIAAQQGLEPGSPFVLVITSSGVRAVDLNRDIQKFKGKDCKCAKLFAKHFKLEDQIEFLSKKVCHLGIGTPNRITALLKLDSLKLDNLMYIFVDWNWRDIKFKRIVDIPEVKKDLLELFKNHFIPHIRNSYCKIGIL